MTHRSRPISPELQAAAKTRTRRPPLTYDRARDLPRLLALWPHEIEDAGLTGTTALVEKIRAALRQERTRGRAGHWCYDLNRHRALLGCYRAEVRRLANLELAARIADDTLTTRRPGVPGSALAARPEAHLLGEL